MKKTAVITLNFGEPRSPVREHVEPFLERIFYQNSSLEAAETDEERRARSRQLAQRRAPGLMEEYEAIGGSPLNDQADAHARNLGLEFIRRDLPVHVYSAYQYTAPLVADVVKKARADGVERLIGLPVYPLCGFSTNVGALNDVQAAIDELGWTDVEFEGITGWHRHPLYLELRADAIRQTVKEAGLNLSAPGTRLVFSAHGTPKKYLDEGSRYAEYVDEFCREVGQLVGMEPADYELGFQNHSNRGVEWTQPDIDAVIAAVEADTVVVDPVSFMHEQSETLAELDHELREEAEERGLAFHRVPVPHDDPRFITVLADLMEPFITGQDSPLGLRYGRCRCRPEDNTLCLNSLPRTEAAPRPTGADEGASAGASAPSPG
ncbi:MAG: ferrochelatase [Gemmatimonadales bacterium]|nr:MAG: ferrochelatase [Gemmatimonadales bacterium]